MFRINWGSSNENIDNKKVYSQKIPDKFVLDDVDKCLQLKNHDFIVL
jgi:hypothetical protein